MRDTRDARRTVRPRRYPSVDDLALGARDLVRRLPGAVRLKPLGLSRGGRPLELLSVGHGSQHILVVAGAHANEPVGGATCLHLAETVAAGPPSAADRSWHFLPCLDPDGARLNEGWTARGLPGLRAYFRDFYRPAFAAQPEFLPPAHEDRHPMPESEVLMALLDELRPAVQFTLHGSEIGGAFAQFTREVPGAAALLGEAAAELSVPVDIRPYDGIDWNAAGPGVLVLPDTGEVEERDPAGFSSRTTWLYPARYGTLTAIVEAPAWGVDAVGDPSAVRDPERVIAAAGEILLERIGQVAAALRGSGAEGRTAGGDERFLAAGRELVAVAPGVAGTWLSPAFRYTDGSRPAAIRGNAVILAITARRIALRAAAMLARGLATARGGQARRAGAVLEELVAAWCREMTTTFQPRGIPIQHQVELQARLALGTVEAALAPR